MTQARDLGNVGDTLAGVSNVNIDSGTFVIDAGNSRVGVGTTAPGYLFEVRSDSNTATNWMAVTNRGTTSAYGAGILLIANNTNYSTIGHSGTGRLDFTNTLASGNTVILAGSDGNLFLGRGASNDIIVNQGGYVNTPNQPFFMGTPKTDYASGSMPTGVIQFNSTYNNGSCFNTSNGRFTAPIAGWYKTTWGGLQLPNTVTSLQVNGSDVHNGCHFAGTAPAYTTVTQTTTRYLNVGDYMTVRGWNGGGYYSAWYVWSVELIG